MSKKKIEKTLKEQLLEVIHEAFGEYKGKWKDAWNTYKTIIGPFIKGTATYLWTLVYGSLSMVGKIIYGCGEVLIKALFKIIEKA